MTVENLVKIAITEIPRSQRVLVNLDTKEIEWTEEDIEDIKLNNAIDFERGK